MLTFKQYLMLLEASERHFAHVPGFDVNNPEHKELVDAYNSSGRPNSHTSKIKSIDQFKSEMEPYVNQIRSTQDAKQEKNRLHNQLMYGGRLKLRYHDPEKGFKLWTIHNDPVTGEGATSYTLADGAKWCSANKDSGGDYSKSYDPDGEHTYIMHFDHEPGNLSRVSINGVKAFEHHTTGEGGNFQDKGNVTVTDEDWNHLRQKYGLDHLQHILGGIRGIPFNPDEMLQHHDITEGKLHDIIKQGSGNVHLGDANINRLSQAYDNKLKTGSLGLDEIDSAIKGGYLNDKHIEQIQKNATDFIKNKLSNNYFHDTKSTIEKLNEKGLLNIEHKEILGDFLMKKIKNNNYLSSIEHAYNNNYLNDDHVEALKHAYMNKLKKGFLGINEIDLAHKLGYLTDAHRNEIQKNATNWINDNNTFDGNENNTIEDIIDRLGSHRLLTEENKNKIRNNMIYYVNNIQNAKKLKEVANKYGFMSSEGGKYIQQLEDIDENKLPNSEMLHLAKNPEYTKAHLDLAVKYLRGYNIGEDVITAIAKNPNSYKAHEVISSGRYNKEAIDAIAKNPNSHTAHNILIQNFIRGEGLELSPDNIKDIAKHPKSQFAHGIIAQFPTYGIDIDPDVIDIIMNNPESTKAHKILRDLNVIV